MANAAATTATARGLLSAEELHELEQAFVFFSGRELIREYRALIDALPHCGGPRFRPPQPVPAATLGRRFAAVLPFGRCPDRDTLRAGLIRLGPAERFALATRLHRLHRTLTATAGRPPGQAGDASLFAVPPVWCRRWSLLIDGHLLASTVAEVDLQA